MRILLLLLLLSTVSPISWSQKTKVFGTVKDGLSGEILPFVKVRFLNSKIGTTTDSIGNYELDTYYATDTLLFYYIGYITVKKFIVKDQEQRLDIALPVAKADFEEVVVQAPDEWPSTTLHKKVIANKIINNKEKLESYEYEVYNKVQVDVNNIGEKFKNLELVKRLDLVMDYLDSSDSGRSVLPVILSENVSDFYFRNNPKMKKEVVKATRISGMENITINQFLGDMYLDVNIYDNYLSLFNKSFISPVANFARNYYKFYLTDSAFIDNKYCFQLKFKPKRSGEATFQGEMWIHDTTYAIKQFKANISPWVNINYVQDLYIEHHFNQVAPEVWMLTSERMIADLKLTKKTKVYGFYGRRHSTRTNYKINKKQEDEFYRSDNTVEFEEGALNRTSEYWANIRHEPLSSQEKGIDKMVDSLNNLRFFKSLKNVLYLATTGYYPFGKIELGSAFSLFSVNQVEQLRFGLALRTSNEFSHRIELGGNLAYGLRDEKFKYGGLIRVNVTQKPKKRTMLRFYYNYDIEQIGQSPSAASVASTFGTLLRTGPLDKLTYVQRYGVDLEKDVAKDIILFAGFENRQISPTNVSFQNYLRPTNLPGVYDTINKLTTSEITMRFRWAKNEEFVSGYFDRTSIRSKYPVLGLQTVLGVKDFLGADNNYQKFELIVEHRTPVGILGRMNYGLNIGYINGNAAYPFLKVHEGNQSYWLLTNAFNKMNFLEFVSDKYLTAFIENHWDGFFLDRAPLLKKLKLRLVTSARMAYGTLSNRHEQVMVFPSFIKQFGSIPYVESSVGIENILKIGRVDLFWRLTHRTPGESPIGVRFRYYINF